MAILVCCNYEHIYADIWLKQTNSDLMLNECAEFYVKIYSRFSEIGKKSYGATFFCCILYILDPLISGFSKTLIPRYTGVVAVIPHIQTKHFAN